MKRILVRFFGNDYRPGDLYRFYKPQRVVWRTLDSRWAHGVAI